MDEITINVDQFAELVNKLDYLTTLNSQLLYSLTFIVGVSCSVFVCFIIYKFLKIFF